MNEWLNASKITGLSPALPLTVSGVTRRALRESWLSRPRAGRGGGFEYHISSLPPAVQEALRRLDASSSPAAAPSPTPQAAVPLAHLKSWQQEIFNARAALYREFEALKAKHGTDRAVSLLVERAQAGDLPEHLQRLVPIANARKGENRTLSRSMILRWQRDVKRGGIEALAPKSVESAEDPPWAAAFTACYQKPTNPTIPEAMEQMAKLLPPDIPMPSYHQVRRWNAGRDRLEQERGRRTGTARQALMGHRRRDTSTLRPLNVGQCDGHSWKGYVQHPHTARPFHPELCTVIDCATRFVVGWSAGLAESALTVAEAVRSAVEVSETKPFGGVFDIIYCDNGAGNTAGQNMDDQTGLFARIGTTVLTGRPGNPQGRGLIERTNASLWIRAAKELPGFTGRDMDPGAGRDFYLRMEKDLREKGTSDLVISWPRFLEFCARAVDAYNDRPHSALPRITDPKTGRSRHMTPRECWAWHIADGWDMAEHQLTPAEIECLWLPRVERVVRRASVQVGAGWYCASGLARHDGRTVQVACYPNDAGRVQVWDKDGRFICRAELDRNASEMFPKSVVERAAENRRKRRAALKERQLEEIRAEERGVVIEGKAVASNVIPFDPARAAEIRAAREKVAGELAAPAAFVIPENERDMYRLWHELDRRVAAGEILEDRARMFHERFPFSDTFRVFREVEETLGKAKVG